MKAALVKQTQQALKQCTASKPEVTAKRKQRATKTLPDQGSGATSGACCILCPSFQFSFFPVRAEVACTDADNPLAS